MPSPASSSTKLFYLGNQGEQTGPFSESEILIKINASIVVPETLIWSEGMSEWTFIGSVPNFKNAFQQVTSEKSLPISSQKSEKKIQHEAAIVLNKPLLANKPPQRTIHVPPTQQSQEEEITPVFNSKESHFTEAPFVRLRVVLITIGMVLLVGSTMLFFYFNSLTTSKISSSIAKKKTPYGKGENVRQERLRKASSELLVSPDNSSSDLKNLIRENPLDPVAKEAIQTLVDYYKQNQKPVEAARIYLLGRRPGEAAAMFVLDKSSRSEAEEAFFSAYEMTSNLDEKKKYLLEDIELLVGSLMQYSKGAERIRLFESKFPGVSHPYAYYVRTIDERIADIFPRISFHFVQTLLAYLSTELSHITLVERPLVEVKKNRLGEYRITGTYRGDILLNNDSMKNIHLVSWLVENNWLLVDTNITKERRQWANTEREKQKKTALSGVVMLHFLETVFKSEFPKTSLHEKINPQDKIKKPTSISDDF